MKIALIATALIATTVAAGASEVTQFEIPGPSGLTRAEVRAQAASPAQVGSPRYIGDLANFQVPMDSKLSRAEAAARAPAPTVIHNEATTFVDNVHSTQDPAKRVMARAMK